MANSAGLRLEKSTFVLRNQNNMIMKKIKTFGLSALHVEECFGYLKQILAETANLPTKDGGEDDGPHM